MSYVVGTARQIRAHLRRGQLVVLESTTYPGTTDELVRGILEEPGLRVRRGLLPRLLAGARGSGQRELRDRDDPEGRRRRRRDRGRPRAGALRPGHREDGPRLATRATAEATKLVENIFRAVNIALVNELKIVFDRMGIDVWEVLDAASTKPFGFMRFNPGPGLGRPLHSARSVLPGVEGARVRRLRRSSSSSPARSTSQMPHYVIEKLQLGAERARQGRARAAAILVLGLAYKKDIDDPRESPAFEIIDAAAPARRARLVPRPARAAGAADALLARPARDGVAAAHRRRSLAGQDAVVIVTDHSARRLRPRRSRTRR